MRTYTKESLTEAIRDVCRQGWIPSGRPGNDGGIGNTLEGLLGITENNLPIPNAAEWELKCQKLSTSSLTTLFHMEPSPRAFKFVPQVLLLKYGWPHQQAGKRYSKQEMSFRQTINANSRSDRGFKIVVDRSNRKVIVSFDANAVDRRHSEWLASVEQRVGLNELTPQPYWGFDDLFHKAGTKLHNCFYVQAEARKIGGQQHFRFCRLSLLERFDLENFIEALEGAQLLVDFDARTGHNHGTKFRLRQNWLPYLYTNTTEIPCGNQG
jgi:hypothetical protein